MNQLCLRGEFSHVKHKDFSSCLKGVSMTSLHNPNNRSWLRLTTSPTLHLLPRNNSSLVEASLPSFSTELHCSCGLAGISPWLINFTKTFTQSLKAALDLYSSPLKLYIFKLIDRTTNEWMQLKLFPFWSFKLIEWMLPEFKEKGSEIWTK